MHSRALRRLKSGLVGWMAIFLLQGCFLFKKSSSNNRAAAASLIVTSSIFIDRLGSGDTARLQFKTTANAVCELAFYSQEPTVAPTKDKPTSMPCSNLNQPRTDFVEKLAGLRSDTLYYVIITAWSPPAGKEQGQQLTVRETPDNASMITGDGNAAFKELFVGRFDIPLMSAEMHRHIPAQPVDIPTIKTSLTRKVGCQQGRPPSDTPFRDAAPDVGLQNLATRDFAAGTAKPNPDHPERLQLTYGSVNNGMSQWTLIYHAANQDVRVPVQPMSQILNMDMESASITTFEPAQLAKAVEAFKIDATKPLKFSWTTGSVLLDLSYMTIQIGRPDYDKAIYCVFAARAGSGSVDSALLQNLDDGEQVVMAELASNQLWVKDGWLLTVYDWRSGRIEK